MVERSNNCYIRLLGEGGRVGCTWKRVAQTKEKSQYGLRRRLLSKVPMEITAMAANKKSNWLEQQTSRGRMCGQLPDVYFRPLTMCGQRLPVSTVLKRFRLRLGSGLV